MIQPDGAAGTSRRSGMMADQPIPALPAPDWLPDRFGDAILRYDWAKTHVARLNDVLTEFNAVTSWRPEQAFDLPAGMVRVRILQEPPREIGLIIGDIVHSLRASLDYATCSLVEIQDEGANLGRIQFPFGRPGRPLSGSERKPFQKISEIALPHIEEARRIGHPYLGVLNRISNQDKHRLVVAMLHRQIAMKIVVDEQANTADFVADHDRSDVWMRPLSDGEIVEMDKILALRPGFVVDGDDDPYALAVIDRLFEVTDTSLRLMMKAAEIMLTSRDCSRTDRSFAGAMDKFP